MSFPDGILDDIRERISLAELVGRHVRLTRRGREHVGLCPFHAEKTPSFTVNEAKGFYHCFGCGAHGSAFDFVMAIDRVGFPEAVARLADAAGIRLPQPQPADGARARQRQSLHAVLERAAGWFADNLRGAEGAEARAYLAGRGLDAAAAARFRLGFAPPARTALKTALGRAGFDEALLVEAGLLVRPDDPADAAYDRFRGRLMFPILDRRGRVVGFGGRLLGKGEPKYLNSPETPVFHKGRLLYGLPAAAEAARRAGRLIVVEGYMDQISLTLAGYEETVAPLGTALTEEQIEALWQLAPQPILSFDADPAGRRAALRAAERALPLIRPGLGLRFAFLATGTGDDPDGVARRYPRQFLDRAFAEAVPLSALLVWLETGGRAPASPEDRAAALDRLRRRAAMIADRTLRQHFLSAFHAALRPAPAWARRSPGRPRDRHAAAPPAAVTADTPPRADGREEAERTLLAILCNHPFLFHEIEDEVGLLPFGDAEHDRLRQGLIAALSGADLTTAEGARAALVDPGLQAAFDRLTRDPFVRRHRLINGEAAAAEVRAAWRQNADRLRAIGEAVAGPSPDGADTVSDATLVRRFAARRAALESRVAASAEQEPDVADDAAPPARRVP